MIIDIHRESNRTYKGVYICCKHRSWVASGFVMIGKRVLRHSQGPNGRLAENHPFRYSLQYLGGLRGSRILEGRAQLRDLSNLARGLHAPTPAHHARNAGIRRLPHKHFSKFHIPFHIPANQNVMARTHIFASSRVFLPRKSFYRRSSRIITQQRAFMAKREDATALQTDIRPNRAAAVFLQ